jgi:energy-coupling factor transporter transmembrane protein EcfT
VSSTSGSAGRSSGRTILAVILGIIALIFIVAAIIYITTPASSLPSFIPGKIPGSTGHRPLRATGSLVVGIVFAVGAWFALAYKPKPQAATQDNNKENSPAGRN